MSDPFTDRLAEVSPSAASPADVAQVEDALRAVSAALRSFRLYSGQGPMLEKFVDAASAKLKALWENVPLLRLEIDEQSIRWEEQRVYPTGDTGPELAFLFYKDGIREITLLPGFEKEIGTFLQVLGRAPQVREEEDDLLTLLWQEEFTAFQYQYVEAAIETGETGEGAEEQPAAISAESVRAAAAEPPGGITPEDFQETLYFLDDAELQRLADEVKREADRDLWEGVLFALYDRIEDGEQDRQIRVLNILSEVLPTLLGTSDFQRASALLGELAELAARPSGVLQPAALREVRGLFGQLASGSVIEQLVRMVESDPEILREEALSRLFGFFPPEALAPLARASLTISRPDVRRTFEGVVERLANDNRDEVVRLLKDDDLAMVGAAVRWVGQLGIGSAVGAVTELVRHADPAIRLAATEALVALKAAVAGKALEGLLEDPDRDVRIGAARALAALEFGGARATLEAALQSKRLRAADRSEKIAFFEAYGRLGGAEAVPLLDRTLNGRSWLGKGESGDIRACAALGLARVRHPSARVALTAAANDSDPVVRSAVGRALKEETT